MNHHAYPRTRGWWFTAIVFVLLGAVAGISQEVRRTSQRALAPSASGEQLGTNAIDFPSPAAFAMRKLDLTEPGYYFFEFYLNDRYLVRVPVLVASGVHSRESVESADAKFYLRRGTEHLHAGQLEKAIADFSEAIRLAPDEVSAYVRRGIAYYSMMRNDSALADFSEAIKRKPTVPDYYVFRGSLWNRKGDPDRAILDFSEAIRLAPESAEAFAYRGASWIQKGDSSKALEDLNSAIRLDPRFEIGYANRAGLWLQLGEYDKAVADASRVIELSPNSAHGYNTLAWIQATCPDAAYRNGAKAVENATRACELSSWNAYQFLDALAAAYAEAGDFATAVKWETKSLESFPGEPENERTQRLQLFQARQPYRDMLAQPPKN